MVSRAWAQSIAEGVVREWQAHWAKQGEAPVQHVDDLTVRIATAIREVTEMIH